MRKVKFISSSDLKTLLSTTKDFEEPLNSAFKEIDRAGGEVVKTKYLVDKGGYLTAVIIEYEINKSSPQKESDKS